LTNIILYVILEIKTIFKGGSKMQQTQNQNTTVIIQQQKTKKPFVIYSKPLAGYLLSNYCELLKITSSIQNPLKKVYMFEDTLKLHQLMEDFKIQQTQQQLE
jgi:replicative superfamily II helicase